MKSFNVLPFCSAAIIGATLLSSCSLDEPFDTGNEGSLVNFHLSFNSGITRAGNDDLLSSCKISLSNDKEVLYNWTGSQNLPAQLYLRYGNYSASVEAGDSLPASFEKKFFKGTTDFEIGINNVKTQVNIISKIRNVVVSVDASGFPEELRNTLEITFKTSDGQLVFNKDNLDAKGYFMRKFDSKTGDYDRLISYTVKGKDLDGSDFSKTGEISYAEAAHEYQLVVEKNKKEENPSGGAFIDLQIIDYELVPTDFIIYGAPDFKWDNVDLSIEEQLFNDESFPQDYTLTLSSYKGFKTLVMTTENESLQEKLNNQSSIDLINEDLSLFDGFEVSQIKNGVIQQYNITFKQSWLNSLEESPTEYVIEIKGVDQRNLAGTMQVRIANTEAAQDAPFSIIKDLWTKDLLSVRAHRADVKIKTFHDNIENLQLQYRKVNDDAETEWIVKPLGNLAKGEHIITLTELDENSTYELRLAGGEKTGDENDSYKFITRNLPSFTTEEEFDIPNAGMEDWTKIGKVVEPFSSSLNDDTAFWDSGNHGSTTISADDNLTIQNTSIKHGGYSSAQLTSKFVGLLGIGKHGAGNIFTGKFAGTEQTTNGKIDLGRPFNQSHPDKLRVWVRYNPAVADKGGNNNYIKKGEYDEGQIYIALATDVHQARTAYPETLVVEDHLPDVFVAFGQRSFTTSDPDFVNNGFQDENGGMKMVEIPFNYLEKAKDETPLYLVIVCAASKYGDYFSGGEGSTMYVDDFELIYE